MMPVIGCIDLGCVPPPLSLSCFLVFLLSLTFPVPSKCLSSECYRDRIDSGLKQMALSQKIAQSLQAKLQVLEPQQEAQTKVMQHFGSLSLPSLSFSVPVHNLTDPPYV